MNIVNCHYLPVPRYNINTGSLMFYKVENLFKSSCFEVLDSWPLLRAEGFFCTLDVLYGGIGIGKL
jgi:hypothetical protein